MKRVNSDVQGPQKKLRGRKPTGICHCCFDHGEMGWASTGKNVCMKCKESVPRVCLRCNQSKCGFRPDYGVEREYVTTSTKGHYCYCEYKCLKCDQTYLSSLIRYCLNTTIQINDECKFHFETISLIKSPPVKTGIGLSRWPSDLIILFKLKL